MYSNILRDIIYGLNVKVPIENGKMVQAINFDNAATTPSLVTVIDDVIRYLAFYSSAHRGYGYKSRVSTELYDECRKIVAEFVRADLEKNSVVFVKNTTEAINRLSNLFYQKYKDTIILSTWMEHHSNDLPWRKFTIDYIDIDKDGKLRLDDLENKLIYYDGKVKLVTVTGASNVTGYLNPIYKIASIAHKYNAMILVDGAQLVPHCLVNMEGLQNDDAIDFLAFSGHKMYAPFGTGVLIGPKSFLKGTIPDYPGGGTIDIVTHNYIKWADTPLKYEPGSPNSVGAVALASAIKVLNTIGMKNIEKNELMLTEYTIKQLRKLPYIKVYCDDKISHNDHIGIVPFNIEGIYHKEVSKFLSSKRGIALRSGCFCAQPYIQRLLNMSDKEIENRIINDNNRPGMVRISFGLYNNYEEVDECIYYIKKILRYKTKG
ncbi:aminotransferase class V-fold PLP-dependent enzyme [Clostridium sp. DL1XJH146]